ncbi:MAG: FAD-dependent oxidoreductase [Beijerinckiaceae bacterium]
MTGMIETRCCIAGGGPAGLMLGFLLARAGVDVVVLEKHKDFLRDFRGDTIHPSTMQIMDELGMLDEFLTLPHQRVPNIVAQFGNKRLQMADFSRLPVRAPFIAMMPQWDFLNFLADKARPFANFRLMTECEALALIEDNGRVVGVSAQNRDGKLSIKADLTVAADGRTSRMRDTSLLPLDDFGAPMDVLWFHLSRQPGDTDQTQGRFDRGRIFIMLNRGDYWQCAFVIPKGTNDTIRADGLPAFRDALRPLLPVVPSRADEIVDWEQVKLLLVQVNRLRKWWRPGFLCIGDAAHAMSPVGGVGVNLAVQDAVAAANRLTAPLRAGHAEDQALAAVQARREWPTRATQWLQLTMQNRIISPTLSSTGPLSPPLALRLLTSIPLLRGLVARVMGMGIRPEHVEPAG